MAVVAGPMAEALTSNAVCTAVASGTKMSGIFGDALCTSPHNSDISNPTPSRECLETCYFCLLNIAVPKW